MAKTLKSFAACKFPLRQYGKEPGVYLVFESDVPSNADKWELFHLADYVVSSAVSGPAYVLTPRENTTNA